MAELVTSDKDRRTQSYVVAVLRPDEHANSDPKTIMGALGGEKVGSNSQFKSSHPSLYMPKHPYSKYRMKGGRDKSGLEVIKEKPVNKSQFALFNMMEQESRVKFRDNDEPVSNEKITQRASKVQDEKS